MTTSDLEQQLREELAAMAATTTVAPDALGRIVDRAEGAGPRRGFAPVSSGGWRTRLVVLAAVSLLAAGTAVLVGQAGDDAEDQGTVQIVDDPPTEPPALIGRFSGSVEQIPCSGDCVGGILEGDLARPDHRALLPGGRSSGFAFLADGRRVEGGGTPDAHDARLVDDASGIETDLGDGQVTSVTMNDAGALAMLVHLSPTSEWLVRTIEGDATVDTALPDWFQAEAASLGNDGSVAVIGREAGDATKLHLYLLDRAGTSIADVRFGSGLESLGDHEALPPTHGPLGISVSPRGTTYAITGSTPEPLATGGSDHPGWTVVIDRGGNTLAALPEWQGLAWSPDGSGLLTARRSGTRTSELRVWYGRDLAGFHDGPEPGHDDGVLDGTLRTLDVGEVSPPVMPLRWAPSDPLVDHVRAGVDLVRTSAGTVEADGLDLVIDTPDRIGVIGFPRSPGAPECITAAHLTLVGARRHGRHRGRRDLADRVGRRRPRGDRRRSHPRGQPDRSGDRRGAGGAHIRVDVLPLLTWARANLPETETLALTLVEVPPTDPLAGAELQLIEVGAGESGPGSTITVVRPPGCTA